MKVQRLFIVDVFAEQKYAGNQLAVVFGADEFSTEQMHAIAREMNYSETTFLTSERERDGGYDVRIFTPGEEVPFAGHPTLGTAWVIRRELAGEGTRRIVLNLKLGQIPVTFERQDDGTELLWMEQAQPAFGPTAEVGDVAAALNLDTGAFDSRFPIQEVSTGLPFLIVPLRGLDAVKRACVDGPRYTELIRERSAKCLFLFSTEAYDEANQINARMFGDYYGVPEDPATGSANGCLAAYLVRHRYFGGPAIDVRVEQGYEIARPSLLRLKAREASGKFEILVGGRVFLTAQGELV